MKQILKNSERSRVYPSSLKSWKKRLRPFNNYASWRGCDPKVSSGILHYSPTTQYLSTTLLNKSSFKYINYLLNIGYNYSLYIPLNNLTEPTSKYIQSRFSDIIRGLGGLSYLKIQYKGKSFKWARKANSILLRFGHSHLVTEPLPPTIRMKRKGRMRLTIFGSSKLTLLSYASRVCNWRPMNVYHGRGLRISNQYVLRKSGKVSAYR